MKRQNFEHVCVFLRLWEHCYRSFLGVQLFTSPVHVRVVNAVYWVPTRHQGVQKIWWQSVWWSSYSSDEERYDNNNEEISHCYPPANMKADIFLSSEWSIWQQYKTTLSFIKASIEEIGDDDATPPEDLLPRGALFIIPGEVSNTDVKQFYCSSSGWWAIAIAISNFE